MSRVIVSFPVFHLAALVVVFGVGATFIGAPVIGLAADGSGTSNSDLLRGTVGFGCTNPLLCVSALHDPVSVPVNLSTSTASLPAVIKKPAAVLAIPGNCQVLEKSGVYTRECAVALAPSVVMPAVNAPVANQQVGKNVPPPANLMRSQSKGSPLVVRGSILHVAAGTDLGEFSDDTITADWAITLRGGSVINKAGQTFEIVFLPRGDVTFGGPRGDIVMAANTELTQSSDGSFRIGAGNFSVAADRGLDRVTMARGTLRLSLSQESENISTGSTIASQPFVADGAVEASVGRVFGRLEASVSAEARRLYVSETGLSDGSWRSNTHRGWWDLGLGYRMSYKLTPIIGMFGQVLAERGIFDAASPSLGVHENSWTYEVRGGLTGAWQGGLSGEIYGGYALRQFDNALLNNVGDWMYGGELSYGPRRGLTLSAALDSGISAAGTHAGATARFDHALTLGGTYVINDLLTGRATAGARWASFAGSAETETGLSTGVGVDFRLGKNTVLNADYGYAYAFENGSEDNTHRVSVGVTQSR